MNFFPLFLRLAEDRRIVIIGGGAVALAKAEALLPYAGALEVVSDVFAPATEAYLRQQGIALRKAAYEPSMLDGVALAIAATNDSAVNHAVYTDARARGVLVNVVDQPEYCDVIFPAIVRRGPLQIAISSSGLSPVLSRLVKQQIERVIPWQFENLINFTRDKRDKVKAVLHTLQKRRLLWHNVLQGNVAEEVLEGNEAKAERLFDDALDEAKAASSEAALYLIGAGPGNPDLLTIKAIRLLSRADVVLYDRLVAPEVLDMYARKEAEKVCVGKTKDYHLLTQESIDETIARHLKAGKIVARLKGGDPSIYAHGAEEIAVARELGAPYQIVPGITAATGCAAAAGIPLTERGGAQSVRFLTLYKESLTDAAFWQSLKHSTNETLVFYMATHHRATLCDKLQEAGFKAATPVLAVEQGTTPQHREYEATLGCFGKKYADHTFQSPTLLIVGDVVRWRREHSWKEAPKGESKPFFPSLGLQGQQRDCAARTVSREPARRLSANQDLQGAKHVLH
jgi:uroporphyrin-III C-methyltransferase / precorrin-2 dehydrogenase / sirohydrochlorin ferrochelatase